MTMMQINHKKGNQEVYILLMDSAAPVVLVCSSFISMYQHHTIQLYYSGCHIFVECWIHSLCDYLFVCWEERAITLWCIYTLCPSYCCSFIPNILWCMPPLCDHLSQFQHELKGEIMLNKNIHETLIINLRWYMCEITCGTNFLYKFHFFELHIHISASAGPFPLIPSAISFGSTHIQIFCSLN